MNVADKTLDIIIPSYRFDRNAEYIERIVNLSYPADWKVAFYLIGDNPSAPLPASLQHLVDTGRISFHRNKINRGLSFSRNKGIDISCGSWMLFMDDDVLVDANVLFAYTAAIERNPAAAGFGGVVNFSDAATTFTRALESAGYTYFFLLAANCSVLPWAVGANMLYSRKAVGETRFDIEFGNSGGEEVDFGIAVKKETGKQILSVPAAFMEHPWWNNGSPHYGRAFRYSRGNYYLLKKHPEFGVMRFCNSSELILLTLLSLPLITFAGINWLYWLLLIPGVLLIDIVVHSIKLFDEKKVQPINVLWYTWLLKMAEQWGYISVCLKYLYGPGFFKRFDIELSPGKKRHFHTNRWILLRMGLISLCFVLVCRG